MKVIDLLNQTTRRLTESQVENPRLNAELLAAKSLNWSREQLYTRFDSVWPEEYERKFETLIQRRISGEPLQYLLGSQEFWSIGFKVDSRVLIPRPETEILVEQSLEILTKKSHQQTPSVLEIGTGSGAVSIALAKEIKSLSLVATDISRGALLVAKENARSAEVEDRIDFINADLFGCFRPLQGDRGFDLILSNPPYIVRSDIEFLAKEVKEHEPIVALDGGKDGFDFYRRIISLAPLFIRDGGWLLLEIGQGQEERVKGLVEKTGDFLKPQMLRDLNGIERVITVQRKLKAGSGKLRNKCV